MKWLLLFALLGCNDPQLGANIHKLQEQMTAVTDQLVQVKKDLAYIESRISTIDCVAYYQTACQEAANATYEYWNVHHRDNACWCVYIHNGSYVRFDPRYAKTIIQSECKERAGS